MVKEYKYQGETFQLDDSEGCYIKVTYHDMVGYIGVNLNNASPERPYHWSVAGGKFGNPRVTKDGIGGGGVTAGNMDDGMQALCKHMVEMRREDEERKRNPFKPEEACHALHEFVEKLS